MKYSKETHMIFTDFLPLKDYIVKVRNTSHKLRSSADLGTADIVQFRSIRNKSKTKYPFKKRETQFFNDGLC